MPQRQHPFPSGRRGFPNPPVHPRRSLTSILRHSLHGQHLAAMRAGQQTLQDFHLAPSAFPNSLGDTHLKPLHFRLDVGPVHLIPHFRGRRGRTIARHIRVVRCHLLSLVQRFFQDSLAMNDHAEVCPLSRRMMLSCDAIPIRQITQRPSLLPQSSARTTHSLPYG